MYSETALDHFLRPRNTGVIDGGSEGRSVNPDCDDTVLFTLRLEDGLVADLRFQSKGCAGAIACCSAATEILIGSPLAEASTIDADRIIDYLDGLPDVKRGCAEMAASGVRRALGAAQG